ncbi:MAG: biotin--[acetyl-CoA-carboxylase] ligase [Verrucomicrobiales bacterium]|nr:biotin--[acetyl-CoA-carboxylase] ligase [Verrucomicrobiales bacterium]MCP5558815.1 biotin--[acetyl-CoA-carboxylase] ligase [Verrucomicrobiaceae bacterium]
MSTLSEAALDTACRDLSLPWLVAVLPETASTNDWLRRSAAGDANGPTAVFTENQTSGRGRRENRWQSQPAKDLLFSLLLRPSAPIALWPRITTLAALAVCRAIEEELPLRPQIKWPNDIYLNHQKVCGLLAETVQTRNGAAIVLGIGINVNSRHFPPELNATSLLAGLTPHSAIQEIDRTALGLQLLRQMNHFLKDLDADFADHTQEVRNRSWLLGRQIRAMVDGAEVFGRAIDLDHEGALVLALSDGSHRTLSSAENVRAVI